MKQDEIFIVKLLKTDATKKITSEILLAILDIISNGLASKVSKARGYILSVSDEIFMSKLQYFITETNSDSAFGTDLEKMLNDNNVNYSTYSERLLTALNIADSFRSVKIVANLTRAYAKGFIDLSVYWKYIKTLNICTLEDFDLLDKYALSFSAQFGGTATAKTYSLITCGFLCRSKGLTHDYVFSNFAFYFRQLGLHFDEIIATWVSDKIISDDYTLLLPYSS